MEIKSMHKGQSVTTVVVANVHNTFPESHHAAAAFAMEAAGESPERLADWDTDQYSGSPGEVTVRLYKR